jgi:hypothetical protein
VAKTTAPFNPRAAAKDNLDLLNALQHLHQRLAQLESQGGAAKNWNGKSVTGTPGLPGLNVSGSNGHFIVSITAPANASQTVLYQLQSCTSLQFQQDVMTYGPDAKVSYDITLPSNSRYFRVRASYDGTNWTGWSTFGAQVNSGVAAFAHHLVSS